MLDKSEKEIALPYIDIGISIFQYRYIRSGIQ
jgi:hypothetical protein